LRKPAGLRVTQRTNAHPDAPRTKAKPHKPSKPGHIGAVGTSDKAGLGRMRQANPCCLQKRPLQTNL